MRSIRTILDEEILALKGMTGSCLKLGGGMTSFAKLTRVTVAVLSKYADCLNCEPDDKEGNFERLMPIDIAVEADRRAQQPLITSEMARLLGYKLVPVSEEAKARRQITSEDAMELMKESMDAVHAMCAAVADGKVDAADEEAVTRELLEVKRKADEILINIRRVRR